MPDKKVERVLEIRESVPLTNQSACYSFYQWQKHCKLDFVIALCRVLLIENLSLVSAARQPSQVADNSTNRKSHSCCTVWSSCDTLDKKNHGTCSLTEVLCCHFNTPPVDAVVGTPPQTITSLLLSDVRLILIRHMKLLWMTQPLNRLQQYIVGLELLEFIEVRSSSP